MAKKKQNEVKQKKSVLQRVLRLAVAAASVYLLVSFVSGQMQVAAKQRQLAELSTQVEEQKEKNAELTRLMDSGNEDAYIERIAREKLKYARPDERIYVDLTEEE